jgi:hypothetical protein
MKHDPCHCSLSRALSLSRSLSLSLSLSLLTRKVATKTGSHAGGWLYAAAVNEACGNLRELPQAQVRGPVRGRAATLTAVQ